MRHQSTHTRWLFSMVTLSLIILAVTACGGTSSTTTTSTTPAPKATTAATKVSTSTNPPFTSTLKFTVSGGVSGSYTITEVDPGATNSSDIQSGKVLQIGVQNSTWNVLTGIIPYHGPATYVFPMFSLSTQNNTKSWGVLPIGRVPCPATVSSDSPVQAQQGFKVDEIKGTFSCPTLHSDQNSAPITISNGQFDLIVNLR